jgi:phosphohistidine swiveling domain-containing protein
VGVLDLRWEKRSAVPFSLTTCSYIAQQYYYDMKEFADGNFYEHFLFIIKNKMATAYHIASENDDVVQKIAEKHFSSISDAKNMCRNFRVLSDTLMQELNHPTEYFFDKGNFRRFEKMIGEYLPNYLCFMRAVDFLSEDMKDEIFPLLEAGRNYTEPVYGLIDKKIRDIAEHAARSFAVDSFYLTNQELRDIILFEKSVNADEVHDRKSICGVYSENGNVVLLTVEQVEEFERTLQQAVGDKDEVSGACAVAGNASGRVKIVLNPNTAVNFEDGDILVAEMTRPDFLPLMQRAAAIVTDAGGILCHAAITARELGIPCVIGTKVATSVFHDGDVVEVDAERGIVKKLS